MEEREEKESGEERGPIRHTSFLATRPRPGPRPGTPFPAVCFSLHIPQPCFPCPDTYYITVQSTTRPIPPAEPLQGARGLCGKRRKEIYLLKKKGGREIVAETPLASPAKQLSLVWKIPEIGGLVRRGFVDALPITPFFFPSLNPLLYYFN